MQIILLINSANTTLVVIAVKVFKNQNNESTKFQDEISSIRLCILVSLKVPEK